MKRLYFAFAVLPIFSLLFSCSKKDEPTVQEESDLYISIDAELPELNTDTKGHVGQVVTIGWENGDCVYVYDEADCLGTLTASGVVSGSKGQNAKLSGRIERPSGDYLYLAMSPSLSEAPELEDGTLKVSLADQKSVRSFAAYSTLKFSDIGSTTGINSLYAKFTFATSQFQIYAYNMNSSDVINEMTLVNVNDVCAMKFSSGAVKVTGEKVAGYVSRSGMTSTCSAEGETNFYIVSAPSEKASDRFLRVASADESYYDFGFTTVQLKENDYYLTICGMAQSQASSAEFTVGEGTKVNFAHSNLYWDGNVNYHRFEIMSVDYRHYPDGSNNASVNGVYTTTPSNTVGSFYFSDSESEARAQTGPASVTSSEIFTDNSNFEVLGYSKGYWKSLTSDQWNYLLEKRTTVTSGLSESSARYAYIVVGETKGVLLFPDTFEWNSDVMGSEPSKINRHVGGQSSWNDTYTITQLETMSACGAVFLPTSGRRKTDGVAADMTASYRYGYYWSHTPAYLFFRGDEITSGKQDEKITSAMSLRLVHFK